jgi:hypothetical protein
LLQSLGYISWVIEANLLRRQACETKVIRTLGPGDIENTVGGAIGREEVLLSLDVVNAHSVVVGEVRSGHVATAWGDAAGSNTTRSSLKSELANLLSCSGGPDVNSGRGSSLTSDDGLSIGADVNGEDIVSVEWLIGVSVLATLLGLQTSVELLRVVGSVHDDAESGYHEDCFAFRGVSPDYQKKQY